MDKNFSPNKEPKLEPTDEQSPSSPLDLHAGSSFIADSLDVQIHVVPNCVVKGPIKEAQEKSLIDGLAQAWRDKQFVDVEITGCDGSLLCHKLVLAATSSFLHQALRAMSPDHDPSPHTLILAPDVSIRDLEDFLTKVYMGNQSEVDIPAGLEHLGFSAQAPQSMADRVDYLEAGHDVDENDDEINQALDIMEVTSARNIFEDLIVEHPAEMERGDDDDNEEEDDDDGDYVPQFPRPRIRRVKKVRPMSGPGTKVGKRKLVWKLYEVVDANNANCLECGMTIRTETGSTIGLNRHLRHLHPQRFARLTEEKRKIDENPTPVPQPDEKPIKKEEPTSGEDEKTPPSLGDEPARDSDTIPLKKRRGRPLSEGTKESDLVQAKKRRGRPPGRKNKPNEHDSVKQEPKPPKPPSDVESSTCSDCHKVFSSRTAMNYHKKVVHSGIRPYRCEECGMTFARMGSFQNHNHNKERSFLCSVCGKTFARKNIRDAHERAHYGDRRFPCRFCVKKFMTGQQKRNHERTHTGERPFQCTDCGRQFAQRHQLTTHTRIHTGEKPYSCPKCPQMFRHLSTRNNHKCEV